MTDTNKTTARCIASCHEASEDIATAEARDLGLSVSRIAPGLLMCAGDAACERLSKAARTGRLAFVRYLMPVEFSSAANGLAEDLARVVSTHVSLAGKDRLAVHVRIVAKSESSPTRGDLAKAVESLALQLGSTLEKKDPATILSLLVIDDHVYGGMGTPESMLSTWPGGESRYRSSPEQISRAESKLLEAAEVFGITMPSGGRALDLGASPGGWAMALASRGLQVTAVDPAELDPLCSSHDAVTHIQATAEDFLASRSRERFDLVVNDMKMDPAKSAEVMVSAAHLLAQNGRGVLTLKLRDFGTKATLTAVNRSLHILERKFQILGVRQLFHNRSEVTVCLAPL